MKPSGTNYLCEIPATWTAKRMKYCADICNGAEYADIVIDEGGFPVMGSGGEFARASKFCYSNQSVLLGRKGTIDKPLFIDKPFWCVDTMFYTKMKREINAKFLYYSSLNIRFDFYVTSTALPSMTQRDLGSEKIAVPIFIQQTLIANFLDEQCKKIDSIVADIEKQIEVLQKYKKSLITETVTKGLDKSVPMKDSGIEWIGEIPEHWEVKRLKFLTEIKDGTHDTPDYVDEGKNTYPLITSKYIDYENKTINFPDAKHISSEDFIAIYKRSNVEKGDIIMPMIGTIGNPVIIDTTNKFAIKNVALFKTCDDITNAKFIFYQFYSDVLLEQFSLMRKGGVQSFVSLEILGNLFFIDTSHKIKEQLVRYLDQQCYKIDSIIESKKEQLTKITQHKKSLIYEYVTGKKRVKGAKNNGN